MIAIHYDATDSTNTRAARLASLNPGKPILVSARTQTAGRGRTGRAWQSPAGGAWFSVAWPTDADPAAFEAAPLVVGLAVRRVLAACLPPCTGHGGLLLKWPNDVLLRGRKLAGILCERTLRPGAASQTVIVGVGINANIDTGSLGPDLRQPPVSLREATGRCVEVPRLIRRCADEIGRGLAGLAAHGVTADDLAEISGHLAWVGERVRFDRAGEAVEGVVRGVDRRGRLKLDAGRIRVALAAGEVSQARVLPPAAAACA